VTTPIPAQGAGRIRWTETHYGHSGTGWIGYAGTYEPWVFRIYRDERRWRIGCRFPGVVGEAEPGAGPDELKATAERWLEEFVSSLGAVFPPGEISDDEGAGFVLGVTRISPPDDGKPHTTTGAAR
jgi:hypothetical protein